MLHQHCKSCCLTPLNVFMHPQLTLGRFPKLDLLILLWLFPVNILRKLCEQFKMLQRRRGRHSTRQSVWLLFGLTSCLNCECNSLVVLQSSVYFLADFYQLSMIWFVSTTAVWVHDSLPCISFVDCRWCVLSCLDVWPFRPFIADTHAFTAGQVTQYYCIKRNTGSYH